MEILTGNLETFNEILAEIKENKDAIEVNYNLDENAEISEVVLSVGGDYTTEYQLNFSRYQLDGNKIEVYAENQNNGEYATVIIGDIADTKLYIADHTDYFLNKTLDKLIPDNLKAYYLENETITQSIARIEKHIYASEYDQLSDYLKGVRDFMNLINGEEDNKSVTDYIINQLKQC